MPPTSWKPVWHWPVLFWLPSVWPDWIEEVARVARVLRGGELGDVAVVDDRGADVVHSVCLREEQTLLTGRRYGGATGAARREKDESRKGRVRQRNATCGPISRPLSISVRANADPPAGAASIPTARTRMTQPPQRDRSPQRSGLVPGAARRRRRARMSGRIRAPGPSSSLTTAMSREQRVAPDGVEVDLLGPQAHLLGEQPGRRAPQVRPGETGVEAALGRQAQDELDQIERQQRMALGRRLASRAARVVCSGAPISHTTARSGRPSPPTSAGRPELPTAGRCRGCDIAIACSER